MAIGGLAKLERILMTLLTRKLHDGANGRVK
jgi:hypothetical protein